MGVVFLCGVVLISGESTFNPFVTCRSRFATELFRTSHTTDYFAHIIYSNDTVARSLYFVEDLSDTFFYIIGCLFTTLLVFQFVMNSVDIVLQHIVSVFVNLKQAVADVYCKVLFHEYG